MKIAQNTVKRLIVTSALASFFACSSTFAYTTASSNVLRSDGSAADTQAAVNAASEGYTVQIPAGSFTWTSAVTISGKGIRLQGAGGGRIEGSSISSVAIGTGTKSFAIRSGSVITGFTVGETVIAHNKHVAANTMTGTVATWNGTTLTLNISSSSGNGTPDRWVFEMPAKTNITHNAGSSALIGITKDTTNSTEVSDLRLIEGSGTGYGIEIRGAGKTTLIHDLRISSIHQGVRDNTNGCIIWRFYADAGFNIGSDITNNDNAIQMTVANLTSSWSTANSVGTNDISGLTNCYIEDSYFTGLVLGCLDCGDNFRGAVRHCVFDNSSITIHGQETDAYGCRQLEVYDNLMIFDALPNPSAATANLNYWITWRGGSGIVTDNVMDDINSWAWGNKNEITLEYQPIRRVVGLYGSAGWAGGYPGSHQPGQGSNGSTNIVEGVYVWNTTGTCAITPVNYNPDDVGLNRQISDYIKVNRDYFTSPPSAGTPFYGYTKYPYPHPLRSSASSSPGTPPASTPPSNAKIIITTP